MANLIPLDVATRINLEVNESATYKTDLAQYGKHEFWALAGKFGDCEDYAALKRHKLRALGYADSVHMAVCVINGVGHAVCIVDTLTGAYVLDNRHPYPMRKSQLSYDWMGIEVRNDEGESIWRDLK